MLLEAVVYGTDVERCVQEVGRISGVDHVEVWTCEPSRALLWVTHKISVVTDLCRELGVLPRRPYWVAHGTTTWEVLGAPRSLRQFAAGLSNLVFSVRIEAVATEEPDPDLVWLTERQLQLFRTAVDEGYFEVPRRISLTNLAGRVSLSKSTLSRTLAVAEGKLLESAERLGLLSHNGAAAKPRARETVLALHRT
jgi:predicted DNA binding protein